MKNFILFISIMMCLISKSQNVFINKSHLEITFIKTTMEKGICETRFIKGDTVICTTQDKWIGITEPIESFYYVNDTCKKYTSTYVTPTELLIYIWDTDTVYMKKSKCNCKSYTDAYERYKALENRKYQIGDSIMNIMLVVNTAKPKTRNYKDSENYQSVSHTRLQGNPLDDGELIEINTSVPNKKMIKKTRRSGSRKKYKMK